MGGGYQANKKIEVEIKKHKQQLSSLFEKSTSDKEITDLERSILETHYLLDSSLMMILQWSLCDFDGNGLTDAVKGQHFLRAFTILDLMSFRGKIVAINTLRLLPEKVIKKLNKINGLRINAAHPETYRIKSDEYKDRSKYLSILELLSETLREVTAASMLARLEYKKHFNLH